MARTQTSDTRSPHELQTGNGIYYEDARRVAEMLNFAFGYGNTHTLFAFVTDEIGWGSSGNEINTHEVTWNTAGGYSERYRFQVWIDPDVVQLHFRTVAVMPASNTGRVRLTVGATNTVHNHTAGATTTITSTLNTSATGTGWQTVIVELDHQTGSSDACRLRSIRGRCQPVTSALPAPPNE